MFRESMSATHESRGDPNTVQHFGGLLVGNGRLHDEQEESLTYMLINVESSSDDDDAQEESLSISGGSPSISMGLG